MRKFKKSVSVLLAVLCVFSIMSIAFTANAEESQTVRVIVKNDTFSTADGAPWDDVLIDDYVTLNNDSNMQTVIEDALTENSVDFSFNDWGYLSSISGLSEYACNGSGGWMMTLNDWFTADSVSAYTVANGELQPGDEIVMMYTNSWGYDCGSYYGDFSTTLTSSQVIKGAFVSKDTVNAFNNFDPAVTQGEIIITAEQAQIALYPEVYNKNYQVRIYLNEYQPEVSGADIRRGHGFEVKDGDTVYVGVGNPAWPSMNSWAGTADETVYTFKVKYSPVKGDLNGNGKVDIEDVTILQRHFAEFEFLTDAQTAIADFDGNGVIDLQDATAMQRNIAEFS